MVFQNPLGWHTVRCFSPINCDCTIFIDRRYCHYILAINILQLVNIDPTYVQPPQPKDSLHFRVLEVDQKN